MIWIIISFLLSPVAHAGNPAIEIISAKIENMEFAPAEFSEEPSLHFFKTGSENWLIGLKQCFQVHASSEKVAAVLDDVKNYVGIFTDLKKAEFTDFKSIDDYSLFTETVVNFPFAPNDRTELKYQVQRKSGRVLYRYTLKKSNTLKRFDGLILIAPLANGDSLFYEYDSFEPDLGMAKMVGQEKIWVESAIGNLQSDLAVKFRAEHPDWPAKKVLEESENRLEKGRISLRQLYSLREPFELNKVMPNPIIPSDVKTEKKP